MQDNNKPEQIESRAATVEEAISEALLRLGARRDEVEITVVEEGKAGVLGVFGRRQARVLATRKKRRSRGRRGGRRRGGKRPPAQPEARRDDNAARQAKAPARKSGDRPETTGRDAARSNRGEDRPRRSRSPRTRPDRAAPPAQRRSADQPSRPTRPSGEQENVRPRAEARRRPSPPASGPSDKEQARSIGEPLAAAELVAPTRGLSLDDAAEVQRGIAEEVMRRAGFTSRCTVIEGEYNQVKITVDPDSAAVLIGRHGSTIDSVEHLVERMAKQAVGDHAHMNLDINNYRQRREGQLVNNAQEAARQMLATDKDVHTPPLCARERRIVHLTIEKMDGVTTNTAGFGPDRHVVITREDKDGAEAAPKESEQDVDVRMDPSPDAAVEKDEAGEEL